jgi:hypothetical protein
MMTAVVWSATKSRAALQLENIGCAIRSAFCNARQRNARHGTTRIDFRRAGEGDGNRASVVGSACALLSSAY